MKPAVILNFHGIGPIPRTLDVGEGDYWIDVTLFEEIIGCISERPDRQEISLTFDDGNASDVEIALPRLVAAGLSAQFFLLSGRLGMPHFVDHEGLTALETAGMTIGSHGRDHVDWRRLDANGRRREFVEARETLAELTKAPVDTAAIPFGSYDRKVLSDLNQAGYRAVYTSDGGKAGSGPVFARTSVRADMTLADVETILDQRAPLAQRLRRRASKLKKRLV